MGLGSSEMVIVASLDRGIGFSSEPPTLAGFSRVRKDLRLPDWLASSGNSGRYQKLLGGALHEDADLIYLKSTGGEELATSVPVDVIGHPEQTV